MTEAQIKSRLRAAGYEPTPLVLFVIENLIQEGEVAGYEKAWDQMLAARNA